MKYIFIYLNCISKDSNFFLKILEIPRNAKEEDIKKSYKKLTKLYHPDKNPENREECVKKNNLEIKLIVFDLNI